MAKFPRSVSMVKSPRVVIIYELPTGTAAILEPGIVDAYPSDSIVFRNQTRNAAQLVVAQAGIFARVPAMDPQTIDAGGDSEFTVDPNAEVGTYQYQVVVTLESGKRVFAIGASTPRIIIRSSSSGD
jgi:hypothetical protein